MRSTLIILISLSYFITHEGKAQLKLDSLLKSTSADSIKVEELLGFAWQYKYSNPKSAFEAVNVAIVTAKHSSNPKLIGNAYYYKGMMCYLTTKLDSATYFSDQAISYYLQINNDYGIASIYNLKGLIYEKTSNYQGAIEQYLISTKFAENTDNLYSQSNPLHNIGLIYEKIDQYDKSLLYYEKALKIRLQIGDSSFIASSYMSISSIHQYLKNDSLAITYSKQAIGLFKNLDDTYNLMIAYNNLGQFYVLRNKLKQANYYFEKSIGLTSPEIYPENYLLSSANRIMLKNKKLNYTEAVKIGEYSLKIAAMHNLKWNEKEILSELSKSYYALRLIDKTFSTQQRLLFLTDSLLNKENLSHIADLETQFRIKEKEVELAQKELIIVRNNFDINEKAQAIKLQVALIIILILIIGFTIWRFKIRKKQQQIKAQLAINQERSRIAMDLHDHLGAELTIISSKLDTNAFQSERASEKESLEGISNQVRSAGKTLRETVWSIQHEAINISELIARTETFAQQLLANTDTQFEASSNEPNHQLSSQQALDIYRIIQESITNAYKYAKAKHVKLDISISNNSLTCKVTDDGIGFDTAQNSNGFGLHNIKTRAEKLGGILSVFSKDNEGTKVELLLHLMGV